ncbi:MAG: phosphoribosylanthranilate isomerase [Pseudomonadota bacterium]
MAIMVKICGLSEPDTIVAAAEAGADWIGFVFHPASPRAVTLDRVKSLLPLIGSARPIGLLVDPGDDLLDDVTSVGVHSIQLHGAETPERVEEVSARVPGEVWKAVGVGSQADLEQASQYSSADSLLLDATPPANADRTGGHGEVFDWSVLEDWRAPGPWILAGGLTPQNVKAAIQQTGARAVDVSTGVERARGVKDAGLIRDFIKAAKDT